MSDMLSIAASGVRTYQTALTTMSENIANAGTVGYSRRTTTLNEVAAPSSGHQTTVNGMGVIASGIARNADDLRAAQARSAGADLAKTETSATWLDRIEGALTGNRLTEQLGAFFNSARGVAADPTAIAPRAVMLEQASTVAAAFAGTGQAFDGALADLDATAEASARELTSLSTSLAKVNAGLSRVLPDTSGQASLLDERDRLLESISALTDVTVSFDTAGRATVRGGDVSAPVLVSGDVAGTVTYVRSGAAATFAVHREGETSVLNAAGGALAGIAEGAQRLSEARDALNTLAIEFADGVNAVQAAGADLAGNPGAPVFATGDPATHLGITLSDPRGIAAAAPGGGTRDNSNLANLAALRTSGGFETKLTDMTAINAATLSARRSVADAQGAIRDTAVASRDAISGVNVDEEAVELIRFQQAYQASSRVVQIARETLQSILDIR